MKTNTKIKVVRTTRYNLNMIIKIGMTDKELDNLKPGEYFPLETKTINFGLYNG